MDIGSAILGVRESGRNKGERRRKSVRSTPRVKG